MKAVAEMTTSELLAEDRRVGGILDDPDFEFVHGPDTPKNCLRRRREIRAELNWRHEAEIDRADELIEMAYPI